MLTTNASLERRLRRQAARAGMHLHKDRTRPQYLDEHEGYMLVDASLNCVVAGERFDLDLADVAAVLEGCD